MPRHKTPTVSTEEETEATIYNVEVKKENDKETNGSGSTKEFEVEDEFFLHGQQRSTRNRKMKMKTEFCNEEEGKLKSLKSIKESELHSQSAPATKKCVSNIKNGNIKHSKPEVSSDIILSFQSCEGVENNKLEANRAKWREQARIKRQRQREKMTPVEREAFLAKQRDDRKNQRAQQRSSLSEVELEERRRIAREKKQLRRSLMSDEKKKEEIRKVIERRRERLTGMSEEERAAWKVSNYMRYVARCSKMDKTEKDEAKKRRTLSRNKRLERMSEEEKESMRHKRKEYRAKLSERQNTKLNEKLLWDCSKLAGERNEKERSREHKAKKPRKEKHEHDSKKRSRKVTRGKRNTKTLDSVTCTKLKKSSKPSRITKSHSDDKITKAEVAYISHSDTALEPQSQAFSKFDVDQPQLQDSETRQELLVYDTSPSSTFLPIHSSGHIILATSKNIPSCTEEPAGPGNQHSRIQFGCNADGNDSFVNTHVYLVPHISNDETASDIRQQYHTSGIPSKVEESCLLEDNTQVFLINTNSSDDKGDNVPMLIQVQVANHSESEEITIKYEDVFHEDLCKSQRYTKAHQQANSSKMSPKQKRLTGNKNPRGPKRNIVVNRDSICEDCGNAYNSHYISEHKRQSHNPHFVNGACTLCGEKFNGGRKFYLHFKTVHLDKKESSGEKKHMCDQCGVKCKDVYNMKKHKYFVHGDGLKKENHHKCEICPGERLFKEKISLYAHYRRMHPGHRGGGLKCGKCEDGFSGEEELREHIKNEHPESFFPCEYCAVTKYSLVSLKFHYNKCGGLGKEDKVKLREKGPETSGSSGSVERMRLKCEICEKRIALFSLSRHYLEVHGVKEEKFKCWTCEKLFKRREYWVVHMEGVCGVKDLDFERIRCLNYDIVNNGGVVVKNVHGVKGGAAISSKPNKRKNVRTEVRQGTR